MKVLKHKWIFILWPILLLLLHGAISSKVPAIVYCWLSPLLFLINTLVALWVGRLAPGVTFRCFLFSTIAFQIVVRLIDGLSDTMITLPEFGLQVAAICIAYLIFTGKRIVGRISLLSTLAAAAFIYMQYGYHPWIHYCEYGTFTGKTKQVVTAKWNLTEANNTQMQSVAVADKIVVLDFWNTGCAPCFRSFPHLQELYDHYSNDSSISIRAVNVPLERDTPGIAAAVIAERGYSFPVAIANKQTEQLFAIAVFPTVLIIKNQTIIFRGNLENATMALKDLKGDKL